MNIEILPSVANGEIKAPPSKSVAHRLLICAALSDGVSVISDLDFNDDITATIECLKGFGAEINICGSVATIKGIDFSKALKNIRVNCNESGSTLRFLIPLSTLISDETLFCGSERLISRPQSVYKTVFDKQGCCLETASKTSIKASGKLKSGIFEMAGDVSSQFLTGLLFTLPLLDGDSEIRLTSHLESAPYVDITIDVLSKFGVKIEKTSSRTFYIKGNQTYKAKKLSVEGDWSNAAFLDAFNLLGGNVTVNGVSRSSFQGDKIYRECFKILRKCSHTIDISDCPDLGPVLITAAVMCNGGKLIGTKRLKIKESDRGASMQKELTKFGVNIIVNDDEIIIPDCELSPPIEEIDCHNDHRIAMSFAVLCSKTGGVLKNAQCVNKSYPRFFDDIKTLGIQYKII